MSGNLTPHLRLTKPDYNSSGWDVPTNENWQLIDNAFAQYIGVANIRGVWQNSTLYKVGNIVTDDATFVTYVNKVEHTSAAHPTTFAEDRAAHPTYWEVLDTAQAYAVSAAASAAAADSSEADALTHSQNALTFAQAAATSAGDAAEQAQAAYTAAVVASHTALTAQGSRNRLINGSFTVWQSGDTFTGPGHAADMWQVTNCTGAARSIDTILPYTYSLSVTGTTTPGVFQRIEGLVAQALASKYVNFSIWVKNIAGSSALQARISTANVEDNFSAVTLFGPTQNFPAPAADWTRVNFTVLLPVEAHRGLQIEWLRGSGTSTTLFTGARVEQVLYATSLPSTDEVLWPSIENDACYRYLRYMPCYFSQEMLAGEIVQMMVPFDSMRIVPASSWQSVGTLTNVENPPDLGAHINAVTVDVYAPADGTASIVGGIIKLDARL